MLNVEKLNAFYGKKQVLFGIDLTLGDGRIAAVIGPNGAGKSTVLRAVFGLGPQREGAIRLNDDDLSRAAEIIIVEADRALALRTEPEYRAQHRRFARAVGADHGGDAAVAERQVNSEQYLLLAVECVELLDIQHGGLMTRCQDRYASRPHCYAPLRACLRRSWLPDA